MGVFSFWLAGKLLVHPTPPSPPFHPTPPTPSPTWVQVWRGWPLCATRRCLTPCWSKQRFSRSTKPCQFGAGGWGQGAFGGLGGGLEGGGLVWGGWGSFGFGVVSEQSKPSMKMVDPNQFTQLHPGFDSGSSQFWGDWRGKLWVCGG